MAAQASTISISECAVALVISSRGLLTRKLLGYLLSVLGLAQSPVAMQLMFNFRRFCGLALAAELLAQDKEMIEIQLDMLAEKNLRPNFNKVLQMFYKGAAAQPVVTSARLTAELSRARMEPDDISVVLNLHASTDASGYVSFVNFLVRSSTELSSLSQCA